MLWLCNILANLVLCRCILYLPLHCQTIYKNNWINHLARNANTLRSDEANLLKKWL
jgi:hypothetical protein